jgi:hypothetical protein
LLPKPPPLPLLKLLLLLPLKPLPLKLLKPPPLKPPLKPLLPKPVLWALLKPLELEPLGLALWLKLRPLLKLLRQWVDPALVPLNFSGQCIQPRKPLAVRRGALLRYPKLLAARR